MLAKHSYDSYYERYMETDISTFSAAQKQKELEIIYFDGEHTPLKTINSLKRFDPEEMCDRWTREIADPALRERVQTIRALRRQATEQPPV